MGYANHQAVKVALPWFNLLVCLTWSIHNWSRSVSSLFEDVVLILFDLALWVLGIMFKALECPSLAMDYFVIGLYVHNRVIYCNLS